MNLKWNSKISLSTLGEVLYNLNQKPSGHQQITKKKFRISGSFRWFPSFRKPGTEKPPKKTARVCALDVGSGTSGVRWQDDITAEVELSSYSQCHRNIVPFSNVKYNSCCPATVRIPSDQPLQLGDSDRYKRCSIVQYFYTQFPSQLETHNLRNLSKMSDINATRLPFFFAEFTFGLLPHVGDDVNHTLTRGQRWAQLCPSFFVWLYLCAVY